MRKPDFFIVGAPRCGTTAMNTYLKQHPEIFMARKESHFFATDLIGVPHFIKKKDKYLSLFSEANDEKRIGEASVMYLYSRQAAFEIKQFYPEANIIIMLRNPVDMLYSLHSHRVHGGNEDIVEFEAALNVDEVRRQRLHESEIISVTEQPLPYRDMAKYTQQVKRYLDAFGRENVWVIIYDELKENPAKVYQETLKFLGVNDKFQPNFNVINPNKNVRSYALHKLLKTGRIQSIFGSILPHSFFEFFERALTRLNTQYASRPPMNPDLKKELKAEFASEVKSLSELLGRDLTYWTKS